MKQSQWNTFAVGFLILGCVLFFISIIKGNLATSMIGIDSAAFAAWKVISDMGNLYSIILLGLSTMFFMCSILEGDN